jgi:hypothetical protein
VDKFYIYFFPERETENPAVKVGYSKHPVKRLKQLQTGHSKRIGSEGWIEAGTEKDAKRMETVYHAIFDKERIRDNGEWFKYSDRMKDFVTKLMKQKEFTRYFE